MPKPYAGNKDSRHIIPSPFAPLARPRLGAHIACIASLGGALERALGGILGDIMETHSEQALAMYLALSGSQARKSALLAAARLRLTEDDQAELVKLYKKIFKSTGGRNNVVHGAWAVSDDYPNALLLCDTTGYVQYEAAIFDVVRLQLSGDESTLLKRGEESVSKFNALPPPQYEVYEQQDLKDIAVKLTKTLNLLNAFRQKLHSKYRWRSPALQPHPEGSRRRKTKSEAP